MIWHSQEDRRAVKARQFIFRMNMNYALGSLPLHLFIRVSERWSHVALIPRVIIIPPLLCSNSRQSHVTESFPYSLDSKDSNSSHPSYWLGYRSHHTLPPSRLESLWSELWCLIHGQSNSYERTNSWNARDRREPWVTHRRTVTWMVVVVVAVICGRNNKEAMFPCKKVRHIAYYERSVYLVWIVECVGYMSYAILLTYSQGLRRIPTFKPFQFVLMLHCQDMFRQVWILKWIHCVWDPRWRIGFLGLLEVSVGLIVCLCKKL